jgi:hypothetical protein
MQVYNLLKKLVLHGVNTDWVLESCVIRKSVMGYLRTGMANVAQLLIGTVSGAFN